MKLIINSITELIHLLLSSLLVSIIPIILLCLPYQIEIQNFSIDIWVPYYNTDKIHRIYNNFPWNLDKRVHLNLL